MGNILLTACHGREDYRIITLKNSKLEPYKLDMNQITRDAERMLSNLDEFIGKKTLLEKTSLADDISNVYFYGNEFIKISRRCWGMSFCLKQ